MVSEKMKERERERERGAGKPKTVVSAPTTYAESLQVSTPCLATHSEVGVEDIEICFARLS